MLRCHMKAEAMLSILCHRTIKSILTFNGVNRPRKIDKNHETSPKFVFRLYRPHRCFDEGEIHVLDVFRSQLSFT